MYFLSTYCWYFQQLKQLRKVSYQVQDQKVFLALSRTSCIGFIITSNRHTFMRGKGWAFYLFITTPPLLPLATGLMREDTGSIHKCHVASSTSHHVPALFILPNSWAFSANELWSEYKSLNYFIHPIWIMQASAYNRVSARCVHYTTWLLNTAQGSTDWCVFQDEPH